MFGLTTLCTGFINDYPGLLALRLVLGVAQAGIYAGCAYLMGSWYTRQEAQRRFSLYLCTVNLACVLGGLIAATIGEMNGLGNLAGWRWIFISEGILTCLAAVVFFFLMPGFPEQVSWLTVEERLYIKARLKAEQGDSAIGYGIRLCDVWNTVKSPRVILAGLIHLSASVPGYMGTYFAPVIVERLGIHSRIEIQLHTAPVWIVAVVLTLLVAYISDKIQRRFWVILACAIISVAGYFTMLQVHNIRTQYGALFLAISGMASVMPGTYTLGACLQQLTICSGSLLEYYEPRRPPSSSHRDCLADRVWEFRCHHGHIRPRSQALALSLPCLHFLLLHMCHLLGLVCLVLSTPESKTGITGVGKGVYGGGEGTIG